MMSSVTAIALLISAAISHATAQADPQLKIPKPLTLSWIKARLESHGAKYVVDALSSQDRYEDLLNHIDSGEADWIALAPQLATGTDVATAEELAISLALGLPKNPAAVLLVLDPQIEPLNPERVCGVPFVEGTVNDVPGYIRRSQSALQRVNDARLSKQKTDALRN
jgi:hypothetical protein